MILHSDSHTEHVTSEALTYVLAHFNDREAFFIETIDLPEHLGTVECGLYGPAMGDQFVSDLIVWHARRPYRHWNSRLVNRPTRPTSKLTVVAGPYDGHPCVLFTVYGGPAAPREPGDPSLPASEHAASVGFWAHHALAGVQP